MAGACREHLRVIQPVARAARIIGGELPAQERVFAACLWGNSAPPSVHAIVVVVPHCQMGDSGA